jgi:type IV secretion system protein VirD4
MSGSFAVPYGYTAARGTFPSYLQDRHLATIGPTRSGKGATVIVQALLQVRHSVIVIDPKGQNAAITAAWRRRMGQEVVVLNPFGLHGGPPWHLPRHRYNPLAHLRIDDPNIVAEVAALSQALILTKGREPYFDDTARDLVNALILYLVDRLGPRATLGHLRRLLTLIGSRSSQAAELLVAMGHSPHRFIREPIGRFKDPEARDIASAINTAITQTAFLDDPALGDLSGSGGLTGSDVDLMQLKFWPTTVYIVLPGHYMDAYARFLRLIISSAIAQLTSRAGGHPVLIILDEFARLENLPAVTAAFGFAAGFNLQLWPFLQDLAQLKAVYGEEWASILANCGLIQFFTPTDIETAEYLQRRGGLMTGETRSRSLGSFWSGGGGGSVSETRIPLLPFERTMSLSGSESLVFFAGVHDPLIAGRLPYWQIPRLAGRFDPDPYAPQHAAIVAAAPQGGSRLLAAPRAWLARLTDGSHAKTGRR